MSLYYTALHCLSPLFLSSCIAVLITPFLCMFTLSPFSFSFYDLAFPVPLTSQFLRMCTLSPIFLRPSLLLFIDSPLLFFSCSLYDLAFPVPLSFPSISVSILSPGHYPYVSLIAFLPINSFTLLPFSNINPSRFFGLNSPLFQQNPLFPSLCMLPAYYTLPVSSPYPPQPFLSITSVYGHPAESVFQWWQGRAGLWSMW